MGRIVSTVMGVVIALSTLLAGSIVAAPARADSATPPILSANSLPTGITSGPDGVLWFTALGTSRLGRIATTPDGAPISRSTRSRLRTAYRSASCPGAQPRPLRLLVS
jgi:streptogramin lyase